MAKKKRAAARRRSPAPRVFRRLTDSLLLGCIRSRGQLYAAPHNRHPNSDPGVAELLDVQDFRSLLEFADNQAERTIEDGQDQLTRFIVCSRGMKTEEEEILDMMRNYYQASRQMKCRVHFYVRDVEKEYEIAQWGNGS